MRVLAAFLGTVLSISVSAGTTISSTYDIALIGRYFFNDSQRLDNVSLYNASKGVELKTDTSGSVSELKWRLSIYATQNDKDGDQRYADLREATLAYDWHEMSITAGFTRVFWGVSEVINVVNVINQSDIRHNINGKEKMGQQHLSVQYNGDVSELQVLYIPVFREQVFGQRPAFLLPISDTAIFENDRKDGGWATRFKHFGEQSEWAIGYFSGTRRPPNLVISPESQSLTTFYPQTKNLLFDGVYLGDTFSPKLELKIGRELGEQFYSANLGVEYPLYPDLWNINELTFVAEYLRDSRELEAETIGQNDIFIGVKGVIGTESEFRLIFGHDLDMGSHYFEFSGQYRLNDYARLTFQAVGGVDVAQNDRLLFPLDNEKYTTVKVHYAF